ncbi:hypothetical protein JCM14076_03220 [Methylosoma difficile]
MKILITAALISLLTACAGTAEKKLSLPENLAAFAPNTPLACQYQKTLDDGKNQQTSHWYFWRTASRTETFDELTHQGEVWERDQAGKLFHTRLFYPEKLALEFVSGDLAALGSEVSWQQLSSIIDAKNLGRELLPVNQENLNGTVVEHYAGKLNGVQTEVDWLPHLQLAARIDKHFPEGLTRLNLTNCGSAASLAAKPISQAELNNFRHIEFTDIGDMESDPMVQRIEKLMGGHQH